MSRWGGRSGWGDRGWYQTPAKKPPPAHGIKMKKAGTTWWGQRWIEALENVLRGDSGRLARGRTYARAGRTHDLVVTGGTVTAKVTGSRPTPYRITIQLTQLAAPVWNKAIAGMAAQAQFAAELLANQMPQQIGDVFRAAGASLFPAQRSDLVTSCSCPDWGDPCKHVAATHYVLGEALDRDPFLLFELRGRTKDQVLDALRTARAGAAPATPARGRAAPTAAPAEVEIPRVTLGTLDPATYDSPREALPALQLSFDEPVLHGAVLLQLGAPAAWSGGSSPAEVLAPLVRAAATRARTLAMAEPVADAPASTAARSQPGRGAARTPAAPPATARPPATPAATRSPITAPTKPARAPAAPPAKARPPATPAARRSPITAAATKPARTPAGKAMPPMTARSTRSPIAAATRPARTPVAPPAKRRGR